MKKLLITGLTLALSLTAFSGELEDVLKKHYEAMGGLDAMNKIKTMKMSGKLVMQSPQGNMEISYNGTMKDGDKMRFDASMQGMNFTQATNGEITWQVMPMMGVTEPQEMTGAEAEQLKDRADLVGPLVNYKEKGYELEYMGTEEVEGTEAHKIKVVKTSDKSEQMFYIDSEYYVVIKSVATVNQMGMDMQVESFPSDYKEVGGIMIPHATSQKMPGGTGMTLTIEKVEINPDVDEAIFNMPEKTEQ